MVHVLSAGADYPGGLEIQQPKLSSMPSGQALLPTGPPVATSWFKIVIYDYCTPNGPFSSHFPCFPKIMGFLVLEVVSAVYNFPQDEAAMFLWGVLSGLLSFKVWGSLVKAQNLPQARWSASQWPPGSFSFSWCWWGTCQCDVAHGRHRRICQIMGFINVATDSENC